MLLPEPEVLLGPWPMTDLLLLVWPGCRILVILLEQPDHIEMLDGPDLSIIFLPFPGWADSGSIPDNGFQFFLLVRERDDVELKVS